jgi:ligand-binding sensor domain-containing protein/DNA-binding CsgD family transcriptional regulator/cbb3-type cytochrome oxidase subunit 3
LVESIAGKDRNFGDVWNIVILNREVYFRTASKIFQLSGETITVYDAPQEWSYLGVCGGFLYAHDFSSGLLKFESGAWKPASMKGSLPPNDPVTGVIPSGPGILIMTLKNGIFTLFNNNLSKLPAPNNAIFSNDRIYAATAIDSQWIALATNNNGIYIIDHKGNIVQGFSKTEHLQNNNVLSIFRDRQGNLWLGLDNGIDFIAYNSPVKHITPLMSDGSGYTATVFQNRLYAGTSNGLFSVVLQDLKDLSFSKGSFQTVARGQTWSLSEVNNRLLLGQHEGAFEVQGNSVSQISTQAGFWNFVPLNSIYPSPELVAGHYKGIRFFNYNASGFSPGQELPGFEESSRFVAIDKSGFIWVSHPYHGVYRISKSGNNYQTKTYTHKNGLPSILNNHAYKIRNEVLIATEKGVYRYDPSKDQFVEAEFYKKLLGDQSIRYLHEDKQGNIWFIHEKQLGVVDFSKEEPKVIYLPELNGKMLSGFEFIYSLDERNIFLGGEKGFYHINYEKYKTKLPFLNVQVRKVHIIDSKDSILYGGYGGSMTEEPEIGHKFRTIIFEYASPLYGYQSNLEYSYRLKGFDDRWSEWTNKTEKEFTNLPSGNYTFEVRVRNNLGNESEVSSYSFEVLPRWFETWWAILLFVLIFLLTVYFIYRWQKEKFFLQKLRFEEEQRKLKYIHELEQNRARSELVALQNEKLEAEINFKNSEVATSAMHLVKKGELLNKIKTELTQMMKRLDNEQAVAELRRMIKSLSEDENLDKEWEGFSKHFDKVHSDFLVNLKKVHPTLTGNELKLCTYLRMNLTTKEIAQLMNISVRGVEISRYRLRKKMGLSSEVNLFDYLMGIRGDLEK